MQKYHNPKICFSHPDVVDKIKTKDENRNIRDKLNENYVDAWSTWTHCSDKYRFWKIKGWFNRGSRRSKIIIYINYVPKLTFTLTAIITNLDDSNQSGSHLDAIYIDKNGYEIDFDSYGNAPVSSHHLDRLEKNSARFVWNKQQLLNINS